MKPMGLRVLALAAGFAGGWLAHDVSGGGAGVVLPLDVDRPSQTEATDAARRVKSGLLPIAVTSVVLGDRAPSQGGRGIRCLPDIVCDPGTAAKSREVAFARVAGRREVAQ